MRGRAGRCTTRHDPLTFVDVEQGRLLAYFTEGQAGDRNMVAVTGSRKNLVDGLHQRQDGLRQ